MMGGPGGCGLCPWNCSGKIGAYVRPVAGGGGFGGFDRTPLARLLRELHSSLYAER